MKPETALVAPVPGESMTRPSSIVDQESIVQIGDAVSVEESIDSVKHLKHLYRLFSLEIWLLIR